MKKLLRLGVLFAAVCGMGVFISTWSSAEEQAAAKPEPPVKTITRENLHGVIAPDDKNIWVVGNYGVIYHSPDGGGTWNPQISGVESLLIDGVFLNARVGWVVGIYGVVLHTTDGSTWQAQDLGVDANWFDVDCVRAGGGD